MGKIRVCLLSRYPPHEGGIATHAKALADGLRKKGHEVTLITYGRLGRKEDGIRIIEVPTVNLFFARGLSYLIGTVLALRKLKGSIDVIHAHPIHPAGTAAVISKRFSGTPVVITSHGSDLEKWAKKPFGRFLFSKVSNSADALICVSSVLADLAKGIGIEENKIRVVPNGIEMPAPFGSADKALLREKLGLPAGKKMVLYVGMLEDIKNPQELLRCAELLSNYIFVFVGGGRLEDELRMCARRNGLGNVRFEGMKGHDVALEYMRAADLLVVPSKFEGFGLSALEGMALGTPVVAKPAGALKDLLAKESLTDDLMSKISEVLENQMLSNTIVRKNMEIAKKFDVSRMVDGIEKVYEEVCKQ